MNFSKITTKPKAALQKNKIKEISSKIDFKSYKNSLLNPSRKHFKASNNLSG